MAPLATVMWKGKLRRVGHPATSPFTLCGFSLGSRCCGIRLFGYSAFDSIRKPPKRRAKQPGTLFDSAKNKGVRSSDESDMQGSARSMHSSLGKQCESEWAFPETLKSGRYKEDKGRSKRVYGAGASSYESAPDKRFFRKMQDYREVEDDDPYAGIFGERVSVRNRRVREWQRQFEEENMHVELPYERTNVIARLAPNWFVRYFVNMRDRGGADSMGYLVVCVFVVILTLWLIRYLFYTPPSLARPSTELH